MLDFCAISVCKMKIIGEEMIEDGFKRTQTSKQHRLNHKFLPILQTVQNTRSQPINLRLRVLIQMNSYSPIQTTFPNRAIRGIT